MSNEELQSVVSCVLVNQESTCDSRRYSQQKRLDVKLQVLALKLGPNHGESPSLRH